MADDVETAGPAGRADAAMLKIVGESSVKAVPLPAAGSIVIGRSSSADVAIDDVSISRTHARLELGPPMRIVDLGSANGTWVGGVKLVADQPVVLAPGEVVDLGSVMVIVQARGGVGSPVDVDAAIAAAIVRTEPFAVVRVRPTDPRPPSELAPIVRAACRAGDVVADDLTVVMAGLAATDAPVLGAALVASLAGRGVKAQLGVACYPRDGTTRDALLAVAGATAAREPGAMARVQRMIERVALGQISVLLIGETGAGKEVLAERIHALSPRHAAPLLRLNCAALAESLLESELFGHEKGAFTGATATKLGLLEHARGGTVFLDEIGEMPLAVQVKLLRVIEQREVTRVGGLEPHPIDVRFVAATHRDLAAEIAAGRFRQDLYFRLDGVTIAVPPLRDRPDEIEPLARAFAIAGARSANRADVPALSAAALAALRAYSWPGNVRELRNAIERAVLLCDRTIEPEHLPLHRMAPRRASPAATALATALEPLKQDYDAAERARILETLERCGGNQSRAARELGISRGTLVSRLDSYGIPRPRKK